MRIWSIGIYSGETPFSLRPAEGVCNPVLTHEHVTDFPASFVADPFMVERDGTWHMFFEMMHAVTGRGAIGLAVSSNLTTWVYQQIALQEAISSLLSLCVRVAGRVFHDAGNAGSGGSRSVSRRSVSNALGSGWRPGAGILADPSPFRHQDAWWMLACGTPYGHDSLRLYVSEHLDHGWQESQFSPLVFRQLPNIETCR